MYYFISKACGFISAFFFVLTGYAMNASTGSVVLIALFIAIIFGMGKDASDRHRYKVLEEK